MTKIGILSFLLISTGLLTAAAPLITESVETTVPSTNDITLATDLKPPPVEDDEHHGFVYLINLYAVKNTTSNSTDGEEGSLVSEEEPEIIGPIASVLLVIENDEEEPRNLDDLAKDLEDEGYQVERIVEENGEAKFVNPDTKDMKMKGKMKAELKKIRRKRCLKCKKKGGQGGYGGGGYGGGGYGGGGGGYGGGVPIAVIPVSLVPYSGGYGRPSGGEHYHQPSYGGGSCSVCGGGGGSGGGGGGGGSYAQASASASSWGK